MQDFKPRSRQMVEEDGRHRGKRVAPSHHSQCLQWRHQQRAWKSPRGTPLGESSCNRKNVSQEGGGETT